MIDEIEVKFLDVDIEDVRSKLKKAGADLENPMRMMKRAVMRFPDNDWKDGQDAWLRVRDEGDKITVTYKKTTEHEFAGAKELEINVSDFQTAIDIMTQLGLEVQSLQESKRETWTLDGTEIVIDEWPWIKPYIEVEGKTESDIIKVAEKLGFNWGDGVFGSIILAYKNEYEFVDGQRFAKLPEVKFDMPVPEWFSKGDKS